MGKGCHSANHNGGATGTVPLALVGLWLTQKHGDLILPGPNENLHLYHTGMRGREQPSRPHCTTETHSGGAEGSCHWGHHSDHAWLL